jgi:hypothetical protein
LQSLVLVYCGDRSDRLRTDDESGATEFLHAFREGGNASDKSSEESETLPESAEMGKKADDRREREEVLVQQILAFLYTGLGKGAESGGGGKGEAPHGSSGHPPLFYRVCPCGS